MARFFNRVAYVNSVSQKEQKEQNFMGAKSRFAHRGVKLHFMQFLNKILSL